MKPTKTLRARLVLSRETLRQLSNKDLAQIGAAGAVSWSCCTTIDGHEDHCAGCIVETETCNLAGFYNCL
jgi:hypothetical protein